MIRIDELLEMKGIDPKRAKVLEIDEDAVYVQIEDEIWRVPIRGRPSLLLVLRHRP